MTDLGAGAARGAAISGIDHLLIAVSDLDQAAATYRRLGFTLSPRAIHSAQMGTANHTIMLECDYFELLGILAPTQANTRWRAALAAGDGLKGFAAATPRAAAARAVWEAAGFAPGDILPFSRAVERADGTRTQARFEIVSLPAATLPALSIFACAQLTRAAVWLPELLAHPNTACAIRGLVLSVPEPQAAAARWAKALPGARTHAIDGGAQIRIGGHAIGLIDPQAAARRYDLAQLSAGPRAVAMELVVADVAACRAALTRGGMSARIEGERTSVGAAAACGVAIEFVPSGDPTAP
jgi:catechol 2,3-dioxygenase-like lactoylglutathione lyase family enzyme